MMEIIQWTGGLGISGILLYNILRIFNIRMKYPHDVITKLNAGLYQLYIVRWAGYDIIRYSTDESIHYSLIGYYLYDILYLLMTPYGRKQYLYFIHHILAIYLIHLNISYTLAPMIYSNVLYFSMELSASMINWMKLCNEYYPDMAAQCRMYTCIVYAMTRMICLPIFIITYSVHIYHPVWQQNIVVGLLLLLYVLSMDWFRKMTKVLKSS
jgi:hypothetical protein